MERRQLQIEMKSTNYYDAHDLMQESYAYQKTKLFMAKRIANQQTEIDSLKEQLIYQSLKTAQYYNMLNNIDEKIRLLKLFKSNDGDEGYIGSYNKFNKDEQKDDSKDNCCNLSGETVKSIIEDEKEKTNEKIIGLLKNENFELTQELNILKTLLVEKNIKISKLETDKSILTTELIELITTIKQVDELKLNKFFLDQLNNKSKSEKLQENNYSAKITSSLGVKINILSALTELSLLIDNEKKKHPEDNSNLNINLDIDLNNYSKYVINPEMYLNEITSLGKNNFSYEKYTGITEKFETELNSKSLL